MKWILSISILIFLLCHAVLGQRQGAVDICIESCSLISPQCAALVTNASLTFNNYANLKTPELINLLGYPVETHTVLTEDGYINTIFRIPYSASSPTRSGKIPVYLMHGVFASSVQWMWQPPSRALVFMLADAGFDVWIGNARGTTYSRGHIKYSDEDLEYWDFSFDEMGFYDLPAAINYITEISNQSSVYYIGHSLGTTQVFSGLTLRPELKNKIRTIFSLATAAYIENMTNLFFRSTTPYMASYATYRTINILGEGQFFPALMSKYIGNLTNYCKFNTINCGLCNTLTGVLFGFDPCQTDFTQLPGLLAHLPDTTSAKTFSHIAQNIAYGTFSKYNYGLLGNRIKYNGSNTPPIYDWSKINTPVVIFYGDNDDITVTIDVRRTAMALGNNVKFNERVNCTTWSHLDFMTGKDADILLYQKIIAIMLNQTYG